MGDMPSCLIEDNDGMGTCRNLGTDFAQMRFHGFGMGMGEDQSR